MIRFFHGHILNKVHTKSQKVTELAWFGEKKKVCIDSDHVEVIWVCL